MTEAGITDDTTTAAYVRAPDDRTGTLAAVMLREHRMWPAEIECPVRHVLGRIGDTWTLLVLLELDSAGPLRFRELLRAVAGISQRMLSHTVRGLERDGLVSRRVFETKPPSVEYRVTPLGESLLGPVRALEEWANAHRDAIAASRQAYDERHAEAHREPV